MWNTKERILHHEKCIAILEMIETLNCRILRSSTNEINADVNDFFGMKKHYAERVEIDKKTKERLINYYKNEILKTA